MSMKKTSTPIQSLRKSTTATTTLAIGSTMITIIPGSAWDLATLIRGMEAITDTTIRITPLTTMIPSGDGAELRIPPTMHRGGTERFRAMGGIPPECIPIGLATA